MSPDVCFYFPNTPNFISAGSSHQSPNSLAEYREGAGREPRMEKEERAWMERNCGGNFREEKSRKGTAEGKGMAKLGKDLECGKEKKVWMKEN